ncbi:MAG: molybdopterin-dependent oxidoreductase [Firmicutes bacterium]|nr:molybdopterin-dependent oxidoreductase [Bacillota bacterium]
MAVKIKDELNVVGKSVLKVDGLSLACGKAKFVDDYELPECLVCKVMASPFAHARIKKIDKTRALQIPGVVEIITHEDIPRVPHTTAGQGYPEPSPYDTFTLDNKVRYVGDRVLAVAAETEEAALEALRVIEVEYEELEPVLSARDSMKEGAPVIHDEPEAHVIIPVPYEPERNLAAHVDFKIGDMEKGFAEADVVLEKEYETQYAQHCPMEPHIAATWLDENNRLVILTSTQVPFHVRRIVAERLQMPIGKVRVIKPRIGGGFGTKQEVLVEDVCAFLTLKTKRPVKYEMTRAEEFISSRTRHPQILNMKVGAKKDGTLTAISMKIIMNTGAYGSHALTVMCNSGSKILPMYNKVMNVDFCGDTVYTNMPVGGAYRGYGATQGAFAMEVIMDEIARELNMDPVEFRKINHIRSGEGSPVFAALGEGKAGVEQKIGSCGLDRCIERALEEFDWEGREERRKLAPPGKKRGFGMCILMQGSSIPEIDMGAASMKINEDGSFNLLVGATDLGTGSDTVLAQVAAEVLGISVDDFIVYSSDTDMTPFDVGAYASSTTYLSGYAVKNCAEKVKMQILKAAGDMLGVDPYDLTIENKKVTDMNGNSVTIAEVARRALYERDQHQIGAMASHITHKSPPPFAAHFVEVDVDENTGFAEVKKYVCTIDCGTAINPKLAEGQCEGAILNGISYALTEEYIFNKKGRMMNADFGSYKIFNTADLPEMKVILVPTYEETGPYGAKSVSEININGALPAISNAIFDAVGVRLRTAPFTGEKILMGMLGKNNGDPQVKPEEEAAAEEVPEENNAAEENNSNGNGVNNNNKNNGSENRKDKEGLSGEPASYGNYPAKKKKKR